MEKGQRSDILREFYRKVLAEGWEIEEKIAKKMVPIRTRSSGLNYVLEFFWDGRGAIKVFLRHSRTWEKLGEGEVSYRVSMENFTLEDLEDSDEILGDKEARNEWIAQKAKEIYEALLKRVEDDLFTLSEDVKESAEARFAD